MATRSDLSELSELRTGPTDIAGPGPSTGRLHALAARQRDLAARRLSSLGAAFTRAGRALDGGEAEGLGGLARSAGERAERAARYLDGRDFTVLAHDTRTLARRHPDLFLGGSLAVGALAARFFKSSGERAADSGAEPLDLARDHPVPAALLGVGLGLLLLDGQREEGGLVDRAKDRVSDLAGQARDRVSELTGQAKDRVSELTQEAAGRVGDLASGTAETIGELTGAVREQTAELADTVERRVRKVRLGFWRLMEERPLAVGAAALALGLVAGFAIPSTATEDALLGTTRDRLVERAKEGARGLAERRPSGVT